MTTPPLAARISDVIRRALGRNEETVDGFLLDLPGDFKQIRFSLFIVYTITSIIDYLNIMSNKIIVFHKFLEVKPVQHETDFTN